MDTNLELKENGPTFAESVHALMNTRRIDVSSISRPIVIEELGMDWAGACYALMGIQREIKAGFDRIALLDKALAYFEENQYGRVFKSTPTRVQFEPSLEFLEKLENTTYLKEDHLHKGSLVVPVGCLGWNLLLTKHNGMITVDHRPTDIPVARNIFIRRGLLEPLRRILRSRNLFIPYNAGTKFGLRLQKSSLTLGVLDHLKNDLTKAIQERVELIWEKSFGLPFPPSFGFKVIEQEIERWHRVYTIEVTWGHGYTETAATIKLIDKTFFLEI